MTTVPGILFRMTEPRMRSDPAVKIDAAIDMRAGLRILSNELPGKDVCDSQADW